MVGVALLRPLLLGGFGGAGGVLLAQYAARGQEQDITYQEPGPTPLVLAPGPSPLVLAPGPQALDSGRAGQILQFGAPREGVEGPLVYRNHVLAYDSARRVPKWVVLWPTEHSRRHLNTPKRRITSEHTKRENTPRHC